MQKYCLHGRTIDWFTNENSLSTCKCCGNFIIYEEKELLGKDAKLCKWCLLKPIIKELL